MANKNYIYEYYQKINDGSITVGTWIHLVYEYIIKGLESKQFLFDAKKHTKLSCGSKSIVFMLRGRLLLVTLLWSYGKKLL